MPRHILEDTYGARGQAPMRFLAPAAVATLLGSRGYKGEPSVAVVESGNHRVTLLSPSGHHQRTIPCAATSGSRAAARQERGVLACGSGAPLAWTGSMRYPMGVASDADGHSIIVADTHQHRLLRLRVSDGALLANQSTWQPSFGHFAQPLRYPKGLAHHVQRWGASRFPILFVADAGNHRVQTYALAPAHPAGATLTGLPGLTPTAADAKLVPLVSFGQPCGDPSHVDPASCMRGPSAVAAVELADGTRPRGLHASLTDCTLIAC